MTEFRAAFEQYFEDKHKFQGSELLSKNKDNKYYHMKTKDAWDFWQEGAKAMMEYGLKKILEGHKLGYKTYDFHWNEVTAPRYGEVVDGEIQEEEPPDFQQVLQSARRRDNGDDSAEDGLRLGFREGKARGKWEATQWEYDEEHFVRLAKGLFQPYYPCKDDIYRIVREARETKEEK